MRAMLCRGKRVLVRIQFLLGVLLLLLTVVPAEQLAVRTYTTADGLPSDFVRRIVRDSHGFLWFCTSDGLSRFNGYEFTTYGVEQGLPHPFINDLLETRSGVYWVATNGGGVCRFNPSPSRSTEFGSRNKRPQIGGLFAVYPVGDQSATNRVNVMYEDRDGQIWWAPTMVFSALTRLTARQSFSALPLRRPNSRGICRRPRRKPLDKHGERTDATLARRPDCSVRDTTVCAV